MAEDNIYSARATISLDKGLMAAAKKRMRALKYRKFSQYVATLIEQDLRDRPPHVIIHEEKPGPKPMTEVLGRVAETPPEPPEGKIGFRKKGNDVTNTRPAKNWTTKGSENILG